MCSNFAQPLRTSGPIFRKTQSRTWSTIRGHNPFPSQLSTYRSFGVRPSRRIRMLNAPFGVTPSDAKSLVPRASCRASVIFGYVPSKK